MVQFVDDIQEQQYLQQQILNLTTPMKIKKVQPSIYQHKYQQPNFNRNTYPQYQQYPNSHIVTEENVAQPKRSSSRSSSPRKPIFDKNATANYQQMFAQHRASQQAITHKNNRSLQMPIRQEDHIKLQSRQQSKILNEQYQRQSRRKSRRKIFERSVNKPSVPHTPTNNKQQYNILVSPPKQSTSSSNIIPVKLNIKQLSQKIKKNESSPKNQQQLLKKISHLQKIVQDIHNKVSSRDIQMHKNKQNNVIIIKKQQKQANKQRYQQQTMHNPRMRSYSEMQSNMILKLQLQQMRRCERIAKQNQMLYGKLVKNIQQNQNQLNRSIATTYRNQHNQSRRSSKSNKKGSPLKNSREISYEKKYNFNSRNSRNVTTKINEFQDFDHINLISKHTDYQNDGIMQITSPFLIQQNEGSITYNSRKKYY